MLTFERKKMPTNKIIIIEDHTIFREILAEALTKEDDIEVVGHWSYASEAFSFLEENKVDLVIIDKILPDMDGIEVTRKIKKLYPSIDVIILTMVKNEEDVLEAFGAGVNGYLPKEESTNELIRAIHRVIKGQSFISPLITHDFYNVCMRIGDKINKDQLLTNEHIKILNLIRSGYSNKEISDQLGLKVGIVKSRISEILYRLNAKDRTHAVIIALKMNLIKLED